MQNAAHLCQDLGHEVSEISYPFNPVLAEDFLLYWAMLAFSFNHFGRSIYRSRINKSKLEPLTLGLSKHFRKNMHKMPMALKRLRAFKHEYERAFDSFDVMLSPVTGHPPPEIGYLGPDVPFSSTMERLRRFVPFTAIQNISGGPGISLPIGMSRASTPIGVQFSAPFGLDKRLLELAFELEAAEPFPLNKGQIQKAAAHSKKTKKQTASASTSADQISD